MEKTEPEKANKTRYSIEEICASMKNRKGFEGGYEGEAVRLFFKETLDQLADGYTVSLGSIPVQTKVTITNK